MKQRNFIFGYGSLMEKESRARISPNVEQVLPIKVHGFKRGWFARTGVEGLSTTFLGCILDSTEYINGIVYEVTEIELKSTDLREVGYERVLIESSLIQNYTDNFYDILDNKSQVWIYLNSFDLINSVEANLPCTNFPIVQSYVDICINGCIEIENSYPEAKTAKFAAEFIRTTHFWSSFWVNDRIFPRRPFIHRPSAYLIDNLLIENLPDINIFKSIYFE